MPARVDVGAGRAACTRIIRPLGRRSWRPMGQFSAQLPSARSSSSPAILRAAVSELFARSAEPRSMKLLIRPGDDVPDMRPHGLSVREEHPLERDPEVPVQGGSLPIIPASSSEDPGNQALDSHQKISASRAAAVTPAWDTMAQWPPYFSLTHRAGRRWCGVACGSSVAAAEVRRGTAQAHVAGQLLPYSCSGMFSAPGSLRKILRTLPRRQPCASAEPQAHQGYSSTLRQSG